MALKNHARWIVLLGGLGTTVYLVLNAPQQETDGVLTSLPQRSKSAGQQLAFQNIADWRGLLKTARSWREEDDGADPFMIRLPAPPKPPVKEAPPAEPPPEPEPPELPFKFVGGFNRGGDDWGVYLMNGDKLYTVHPGDQLDKDYHVDEIGGGLIVFTYKPMNAQQVLEIGASQ